MNKILVIVLSSLIIVLSFVVFFILGMELRVLESGLLIGMAFTFLGLLIRFRKQQKNIFLTNRSTKRTEEQKDSIEYAEYKRDQRSLWLVVGIIFLVYVIVVLVGYLTNNY